MTRFLRQDLLRVLLASWCLLTALYLLLPALVILVLSFSSSRFLRFPPPGYSFRWYQVLVSDPSWVQAALLSVEVALLVTLLSTTLGTLAAVGLTRWNSRYKDLVLAFLASPLIVPAIVTAVSMFLFFAPLRLIETRLALILAHTTLAIPLVVLTVSSSLYAIGDTHEACARTLGATRLGAFCTVTLPLIRPGIVAGAILAFITSFDEPVIALFVAGTRSVTLPKRMWDGIRYEIDPTVAAVSTIIICLTSIVVMINVRLSARALKPAPGEGTPVRST